MKKITCQKCGEPYSHVGFCPTCDKWTDDTHRLKWENHVLVGTLLELRHMAELEKASPGPKGDEIIKAFVTTINIAIARIKLGRER